MQNTTLINQQILTVQELIDIALERKEGGMSRDGALVVVTGKRTGRSPKDRYIVKDAYTQDDVDWGEVNQPTTPDIFHELWHRALAYLDEKQLFVQELQVGADEHYALPVKVITELAWHNVFCQHLFVRPKAETQLSQPEWTLMNAAGLKLNPVTDDVNGDGAVMINFTERKVLLCGMLYAGEMKKAMFTALNFLLPKRNVLPMHCASNVGEKGDVALFFGLSGTGKTTLSADPARYLIGDDEHGWSERGIANFEGGCYAKCINLSKEREPMIWDAIRDGAIMENVVLDSDLRPDYTDSSLTLNTRAAYPREHIPKRVIDNQAGLPKTVILLTCDLYGVLPPIALLSNEQAAYYFLSGYTALVGSTEVGSLKGIHPTFSACFGAPFFPRPATVYADLLIQKLISSGANAYLVNTGWTGGAYGKGGKRFAIPVTRRIVSAAIEGEALAAESAVYPGFGFRVPTRIQGVDDALLNPRQNWDDLSEYVKHTNELIEQFQKNFMQFSVAKHIAAAGPRILE